jgi:3-phenylpropionate/trans-cinnamate dioxygenase ferredoxin subunit
MRGHAAGQDRFILLANVGGRYFALDGWCNHAGCLLSEGRLDGSQVACPCHGMTFDVRTGAATSRPRLCDDQRTFPVSIEGGEVFVEVE